MIFFFKTYKTYVFQNNFLALISNFKSTQARRGRRNSFHPELTTTVIPHFTFALSTIPPKQILGAYISFYEQLQTFTAAAISLTSTASATLLSNKMLDYTCRHLLVMCPQLESESCIYRYLESPLCLLSISLSPCHQYKTELRCCSCAHSQYIQQTVNFI